MANEEKNGYYLFVYSEIDELMNALGNSVRHDHNMALFYQEDNEVNLIKYWEFERDTGIKHHSIAFRTEIDYIEYLNHLLKEVNLSLSEINSVIGTPYNGETDINFIIEKYDKIAYHSICHLFSSMLSETQKTDAYNVIALALDGGPDVLKDSSAGEKSFFSAGIMENNRIVDIIEIPSPGAYWAYASNYFNIPEGTLMALAYATTTVLNKEFENFPAYKCARDRNMLSKYMENFFAYIMELNIKESPLIINYDERYTDVENKISVAMKIIQKKSIIQLHQVIEQILFDYKLDPANTILSLSGGFALNCPTNTYLMQNFKFAQQICCPCVNDGGISLGMGLNFFYEMNPIFNFKLKTSFYGHADKREVLEVLKLYDEYIADIVYSVDDIGSDILKSPVVWFWGNGEIGPRALGHRSILANPAKMEHKDLLNMYKQREWWRPVAPIVIEKYEKDWFVNSFPSKYMLNNFRIRPEKEKIVPAIVHLDGTCRVQTISDKQDKMLYEIVKKFYEVSGIPIVCNTSLNDHNEPIVNSIEEAIEFALDKKIPIAYINGYRVLLKNNKKFTRCKKSLRNNKMFTMSEMDKKKIILKKNPYGLSKKELLLYKYNPQLNRYDLKVKKDAERLKRILEKLEQNSFGLLGLEIISAQEK